MSRRRPTKEEFNQNLEELASTLRNEIIQGTYAPNEFLPSEKALATRFDMSNISVRKGLELLVEEGWIEKIPRVGNRVVSGRPVIKLTLTCSIMAIRNLILPELLQDFYRLYPWISVEVKELNAPRYDQQSRSFTGDVIIVDHSQFERLVETNAMDSLEKLTVNPYIYPMLSKLFTVNGDLLMQPLIFSPVVLCYNKKHFREAGLLEPDSSWTWNDLLQSAVQLFDDQKRYGFCFHIYSENRWPIFLMQSGEGFKWDGTKLQDFRDSRLMDAIKRSREIFSNRKAFPFYISEDNEEIVQMFREGKISMTLNSYMGMNHLKETDLEYDICPVPTMYEPRTLIISTGAGINSDSSHKQEAQLFVDYLASERAQKILWEKTLSVPSLATIDYNMEKKKFNHPRRYMLFRETMSLVRPLSYLNIPSTSFRDVTRVLKAYWGNMIDEDELVERLTDVLSKEIDR